MIAVYRRLVAWSALVEFIAWCAVPPQFVPTTNCCRNGLLEFYRLNNHVLHLGQGEHHQELQNQHLDTQLIPIAMLPNLNNLVKLQWLNSMTTLIRYHFHVIHLALARLARFVVWIQNISVNPALDSKRRKRARRTNLRLRQCHNVLSGLVGPPPPNILPAAAPLVTVFSAPLPVITWGEDCYQPCQSGVAQFYYVHTFASLLNHGGVIPDPYDQNLNYPIEIYELPYRNTQVQLKWLNKVMNVIANTSRVIRSGVWRMVYFMNWLNLIIQRLPLPGANHSFQIPAAWRNLALETNSLLVQCSTKLLYMIGLPPQVDVVVVHPEPLS